MKLKKKVIEVWKTTQNGYNQSIWFFTVLFGGVILDQFIGIKGLVGAVLCFGIFYGIGHLHNKVVDKKKTFNKY